MKIKKSPARIAFEVFNTLFMLFIVLITVYPMYHVVVASFSEPYQLAAHSGFLLRPYGPYEWGAYRDIFNHPLLISGFTNTVIIVVGGTALNILFTSLGAFFMSQKGPMLKGVVAVMIIITMYFGGGLVPSYMLVKNLGLMDTRWAIILPGLIGVTNLIILKTSFQTIPDSLTESALLDGASYLQIMFRIMLPLSKATIAVLVLYYALGHWNAWFSASIYLRDRAKFPLQLAVKQLLESDSKFAGDFVASKHAQLMKYGIIVVTSAPVIAIYPFLQKYFTKGVLMGSVKG